MASPNVDAEVMQIGSVLGRRLNELAQQVVASIQANVAFDQTTPVVTHDELLASSSANALYIGACSVRSSSNKCAYVVKLYSDGANFLGPPSQPIDDPFSHNRGVIG